MRAKKEINIQMGERIKLAREQAKLTQEQFAERIGVSPQYISDLERGVVGLSVSTLKTACAALCVSSDQILYGTGRQDRAAILAEKCKTLTDEQFLLLSGMVSNFTAAVELERHLETQ